MRATQDTVVTIEYTARLDDGSLIDSTEKCGPISYLHGNEQIFPALERAVEGLEPGAESNVHMSAAESYGERREELVRRVPRTQLPPKLDLKIGERYTLRAPDGRQLMFQLVAIEGEEVVADFNHRGAGQGLRIHAKVLAVRPATADELRRGTLR